MGFIPPAVTGATLVWLDAPEFVLVVGLVLAGFVEGTILGFAQARVITVALPGVNGWVRATAGAAGLAWLAGMGGSSLLQAYGLWLLVGVVPAWLLGLLAMGVWQWSRLQTVVENAQLWIPYTTGAWLIGVCIPVVALSLVPNEAHLVVHVIVAVAAAVAMGVTVGLITYKPLGVFVEASTQDL